MSKNILLFNPSFSANNMHLPYFWASAKTYYERQGKEPNKYNWVNPLFNFYNNIEEIKQFIQANPPAVFGISLYVWNHTSSMAIAAWVKENYPDCVVISGGPHQYFKHETSWFQDHPFLDASLAGDEYGEITICDILDNLDNLSWNKVHAVVYPNKNRKLILQSSKTANKRTFWWEYSAYADQFTLLQEYKQALDLYNDSYRALGILETTRGCPYSCTFCDWGGGTGSKVIARDMKYVRQDIEYIAQLEVDGMFICDANLGILKERDVAVVQHIADTKKKYDKFYAIHYGGYAKTPKALPYIKQILEIEAQHYLTRSLTYKLSIQTLDQPTLKNIDRTDVSLEHYLELSRYLQDNHGYDAYAEIICGLPGITPDKFYHEMDVFSSNNITMNFYEWYLLPETPSYTKEYRQKYQLGTVKKLYGVDATDEYTAEFERESEMVVTTYSYTYEDYKEMQISYGLYRAIWTGGFLDKTLKQLNIPLGEFVKSLYREFFTKTSNDFIVSLNKTINQTFDDFKNKSTKLLFTNDYLDNADPIRLIMFTIFLKLDLFKHDLTSWVSNRYNIDITADINSTITYNNYKTKKGFILKTYYYHDIFEDAGDLNEIVSKLSGYLSSSVPVPPLHFLRAKTTLF